MAASVQSLFGSGMLLGGKMTSCVVKEVQKPQFFPSGQVAACALCPIPSFFNLIRFSAMLPALL